MKTKEKSTHQGAVSARSCRSILRLIATASMAILSSLPLATTHADDSFWSGGDVSDTTVGTHPGLLNSANHQSIHDAIAAAMPAFSFANGGINWMPTGEMIDGDRGLRIYDQGKAYDGYTVINSLPPTGPAGNNVVVIDMYGNIVNEVPYRGAAFNTAAKLLPNGDFIGGHMSDLNGDGIPETPGVYTQKDWCGNIVHQLPYTEWASQGVGINPGEGALHHDHQRQGNSVGYTYPSGNAEVRSGKSLLLTYGYPDPADTAHISATPLEDDMIVEVSWDNEVLFVWRAWEHIDQLGLDEAARNTIMANDPANGGIFVPGTIDYAHGNAVSWIGKSQLYPNDRRFHPDNIMVDLRSLNVIFIIARHDDPEGEWEQGDIIYRIGPGFGTHGENGKVGQIIGQHMAHIIPQTLDGGGNLLVFDNGGGAGYGALIQGLEDAGGNALGHWPNKFRYFSRVLEIDPRTREIVWEYKQPKPSEDLNGDGAIRGNEKFFFSNIMSGAQRLPNGNTFITEADTGRLFEVTNSGEVVWEYVPTWAGGPGIFANGMYRAYRVPKDHIPKNAECAAP